MRTVLTNIRTVLVFAALCFSAALVIVVFIPSALVALGCAGCLWFINGLFNELESWSWVRGKKVLGGEE